MAAMADRTPRSSITPDTLPTIITPPSSNPSGEMVWDLGDLPGTVFITGMVTATVQNIAANQQGVALTNEMDMSYMDDGQGLYLQRFRRCGYPGTDLSDREIGIHQWKPQRAQPFFTKSLLYHSTTSTVPAYNVNITDVIPAGLNYIASSWQQYAGPLATSPMPDDSNLPELIAGWSEIPTTR